MTTLLISGFWVHYVRSWNAKCPIFLKATLPLKPATIPLKIGHLAFQDVFLPTFLDATKTKKPASEAQGISSGVAVENLPIFQVAGADAVPHGFMVVLNHPKIM